jgi:hypothetical protein
VYTVAVAFGRALDAVEFVHSVPLQSGDRGPSAIADPMSDREMKIVMHNIDDSLEKKKKKLIGREFVDFSKKNYNFWMPHKIDRLIDFEKIIIIMELVEKFTQV